MARTIQKLRASGRYVAKFLTALLASGAVTGVLAGYTGPGARWIAVGLAFAGALGVYAVPNKPVIVP